MLTLAVATVAFDLIGCANRTTYEIASPAAAGIRTIAAPRLPEFQGYDEAFLNSVKNRWGDLLDQRRSNESQTGKVVVAFTLHSDGRVSGMEVIETTVSPVLSFLCQKAILDPVPYLAWPADIREKVAANERRMRFTFHYE